MRTHFLFFVALGFMTGTIGFAAEPAAVAAQDDAPRIGPRQIPSALDGKAAAFARTAALCKVLAAPPTSAEAARKAALAALSVDAEKTAAMLLLCLDPANAPEREVRLGALAAIQALKTASNDCSQRLALTAATDPAEIVRKAAVALIKDRKDDTAVLGMVQNFVGAYDERGAVKNEVVRDNSVSSLRDLGDKRVYHALLYYVMMELRTQVASLNNFTTRQINSYTVNNGANATVLVPLSFPIQFPDINITSVKTTVVAPAAALTDLSGQDFGNDVDKWAKWIRKQ